MLTKLIFFCENYNGIVIYFIADSCLLLASSSVGFLYSLVQNLIFLILTYDAEKL